MWTTYAQALLLALAMAGVAFGIAQLIVFVGERLIEKQFGTVGVRDIIARRARLEQGLDARRGERTAEIKAIDGEIQDLMRRRQRLNRQLSDSLGAGDQLIRQIGEEVEGTPCFIGMVVNKYVGSANQQHRQHALIDTSWAQPQVVEVWTRSLADARAEIERRYPPAFGFSITRLDEAGSSARGA